MHGTTSATSTTAAAATVAAPVAPTAAPTVTATDTATVAACAPTHALIGGCEDGRRDGGVVATRAAIAPVIATGTASLSGPRGARVQAKTEAACCTNPGRVGVHGRVVNGRVAYVLYVCAGVAGGGGGGDAAATATAAATVAATAATTIRVPPAAPVAGAGGTSSGGGVGMADVAGDDAGRVHARL